MKEYKTKKCKNPDCSKNAYSNLQPFCGHKCRDKIKPKKQKEVYTIPKVSQKRQIENLQYQVLRTEFLGKKENQICFIDGCNKQSTTIEHRAGRWGKNFLDISTWAGCCLEHNLELENNPELSKKYQFSKITGKSKI